MRKRLITPIPNDRAPFEGGLDVANLAMVEITSEDEAFPIEFALQPGEKRGLARCRARNPDHPTLVRPAAKAQTYPPGFRGNRDPAHTGVRPQMVARSRALLPRNCSPAMEFQSTRDSTRDGGLYRGALRRDYA
jgi:hypothetical protein